MRIVPVDGLEERLGKSEDAELISPRHYALDIFDIEEPITLELEFNAKGSFCPAAAKMKFDEEMDGWYMDERIRDPKVVHQALVEWMKLGDVAPAEDAPAEEK